MARGPLADLPTCGRISRFIKAVRRGAEAFREELMEGSPGERGRHDMDPYNATMLAINQMEHARNVRVDKRARDAAAHFIDSLRRLGIPVPDVGPTPDRGVAMSWTFDTPEGQREIDVVFLDWDKVEYRDGYAERDGFIEETMLDEAQLRDRLRRALESGQHVA